MALATGGSAVGAIRIRSRPMSCALRTAASVGMISTDPSGKTARTSRTRIASFTFSRIFGRRGGKFLGGIIERRKQRAASYGNQRKDSLDRWYQNSGVPLAQAGYRK